MNNKVAFVFTFVCWMASSTFAVAQSNKLYWIESSSPFHIRRANLDGTNMETLHSGAGNCSGLALDEARGKMYWTVNFLVAGLGKIRVANLDGTNPQDLVTGLFAPSDIALDLAQGKLYWSDYLAQKIQRSNLNGIGQETIFFGVESQLPFGLAIDPVEQKIYWSNIGGVSPADYALQKANLDGSDVEVLVNFSGGYAPYLDLDLLSGTLFWTLPYSSVSSLRHSNLEGAQLGNLFVTPENNFRAGIRLDSIASKIYWVEGNAIHRGNLDGSNSELVISAVAGNHISAIALELPSSLRASSPPANSIDARQPHLPNNARPRQGLDSIDLYLSRTDRNPSPRDLAVSEIGGDGIAPTIVSISNPLPSVFRVQLAQPVEAGTYTCFTHLPSQTQSCIGYLPGDVNGDGTSSPVDILALINSLNNIVPRSIYSTDLNRSGIAESSDILRLIDLLNGAGAFEIWNGVSLP